jgi:hypothetical protein
MYQLTVFDWITYDYSDDAVVSTAEARSACVA